MATMYFEFTRLMAPKWLIIQAAAMLYLMTILLGEFWINLNLEL